MIRTTFSFAAFFGLLALACNLLFTHSQQNPASEPRQTSTTDEKCGDEQAPAIRSAQREDKPLSLLQEPVQLKSVGLRSNGEIQLVEFEEGTSEQSAKKSAEETLEETEKKLQELTKESTTEEDSKPMGPEPKAAAEPELSPEMKRLREEIRECLSHYYIRPENVAARSPWACMHAMIAYGVDANLIVNNQRVNAIGYMNFNGNCNGQQLFYTQGGKLQARIGPGVQGHAGQYLAMLAQSRVKTNFPIKVDTEDFNVADLIEHEKLTCKPNTELTFKLIALTHYLRSDDSWTSNDGQSWDIPRLIKEELNQKIVGAACGGTHRLMGFSYAVRKREQRGEVIEGQWLRAKKFLESYHAYTFRLQNPDGSFSTEWFVGRADNGPPGRRLETTGHITEWLTYSLSKEELTSPEMVKSVSYLTKLLYDNRSTKWNIGPMGHGLHALATYDERVFGGEPGKRAEQLAKYARPTVIER
ncbi:hypothetical protein [Anatilimnocola floriformis]|uniref:hypothetical protein n=1 Tax=Anatilimnocola floriformis TaxID=2948575 RepID=UPI0020C322BE|nr:hypothetical protein [Anatilimnocola floriformis]